jgi:hypothetical protein
MILNKRLIGVKKNRNMKKVSLFIGLLVFLISLVSSTISKNNQVWLSKKFEENLNDECDFPLKYLDGSISISTVYDEKNKVFGFGYGTKSKNLSTKTSYTNLRFRIDFVNNKLDTIYTIDFVVDRIIGPGETIEFKSEEPFKVTQAQFKAKYHQYVKIVSAECVK